MSSLFGSSGALRGASRQLRASSHATTSAVKLASSASSSRHSSSSSLSVVFRVASQDVRFDFTLPRFPTLSARAHNESSTLANTIDSTPSPLPVGLAGADGSSLRASEEEADEEDPLQWDGFLNAVPKKKVSHSRKRMRSANKGLKDRIDLVHCAGCGQPKASHHICPHCFGDIARRQKAELKERSAATGSAEASAP